MKILQLNGYSSPGRRFNGLSLKPFLKKHGIDSTHLVWVKDTDDPEVMAWSGDTGFLRRSMVTLEHALSSFKWFEREFRMGSCKISARKVFTRPFGNSLTRLIVNRLTGWLEAMFSVQSMLYLNSIKLSRMPVFKQADLLHLHIIHSGYLSLWALPGITRQKPTVWTLHDPWAMTGHCIHPFDCTRWKTGCGACPRLRAEVPLRRDTTSLLFRYKRYVYSRSNFDLIVASRWMLNMVETSPMLSGVRVHHVPFGLDLDFFSPDAVKNPRSRFGIPENALVISFRAESSEFKGLDFVKQAIRRIHCDQPVYLLIFAEKGLLDEFSDRFHLVELGWSKDEQLCRDAFVSADVFLMPSLAEAFGMMAIEAMACGTPVISFEGTALPEVTFAPEIGVSVPIGDTEALLQALQRLIDHPEERMERGRKGRLIAEKHYDAETQADRLAEIYRMVASR